ncbi:MAG: SMC family ATPase [Candidatus Aenigmarchaeota archaeon]|nr:SMC family ATPase [Candidatus Aenigmarchaeota archaeon]
MILKSLKLKNIRSYVDETIVFPLGSVLLSGDIGSGKSTILLAIDFAFFGLQKGEIAGSELLRHGKNAGSVELEFELDGKRIVITRTLRRNTGGIGQHAGGIEVGGVFEELMPTEMKARILQLFGYPKAALRKNIPLFRYTVYTPQEQMKYILFDQELRMDVLRKLFGIDKYRIIRENSRLLLAELRSRKREKDALAKDIDATVREKEEKELLLVTLKEEQARTAEGIQKLNGQIEASRAGLAGLREAIAETQKLKQQVVQKETEIKTRRVRLRGIDDERDVLEAKLASAAREMGRYALLEQPRRDERTIHNEIRRTEKERDDVMQHRAIVRADAKNHESILNEGMCSVCGRKVDDMQLFSRSVDSKRALMEQLDAQLASIEEQLLNLRKEQEAIRKFMFDSEKKAHHEQLHADMRGRKEKAEAERAALDSEIAVLSRDLALLVPGAGRSALLEAQYADIEKAAHQLTLEKLALERAMAKAEQKIEDTGQRVQALSAEMDGKQKAAEEGAQLGDVINWLDQYLATLMDVMERHVMLAIQREFDAFFRHWFSVIMGEENLDVKIDESFSPVIEQNSFETDYANLSGGEKTAVALAYRLALNKVINMMIETIQTKDVLILDEPTDGFSPEQLDRIRDVIRELGLQQVVIVSHEPKIDTFVDSVIRIAKDQHVSRVVKEN